MNEKDYSPFVSITSVEGELHALDKDGFVWKYYPAEKLVEGETPTPSAKRSGAANLGLKWFAFWGRLSNHRANPET